MNVVAATCSQIQYFPLRFLFFPPSLFQVTPFSSINHTIIPTANMPPKKATAKSNVKSPRTKKRPDLKNLKFYEHTTEQKAVKYMAALLHRKPKYGWPTDEELALVQSSLLPPPTPRGLRPYATDALLSDAAIWVDDAKLDRPRSWNTSRRCVVRAVSRWSELTSTSSAYLVREGYSASYPPELDDFDMPSADSLVPPPLSLAFLPNYPPPTRT